jgi:ABC-type bacteriocin/lantibiotic exporter with double-glycine peptidase domain
MTPQTLLGCCYARKLKIEPMDTPMKKSTKSTNWGFWKMYIDFGLNGHLINVLLLNPIACMMIVIELIINASNTYASTIITKTLSDTSDIKLSASYFVILLMCVLYAPDISKLIERLTRTLSYKYKEKISERISMRIANHIAMAPPEVDAEYNSATKHDAYSSFMMIYYDLSDTIVKIITQTMGSLIVCIYIIYQEPRIFFLLALVYFVMLRYIIPWINVKRNTSQNSDGFWYNAYAAVASLQNIKINPLTSLLYHKKNVKLRGIDIDKVSQLELDNIEDGKITFPDPVNRYIDINYYYVMKHASLDDRYDYLQTIHHTIIIIIMLLMFFAKKYDVAIIILINRYAMFSVIETISSLKRIEHNADRQLEHIQKILDAIDKKHSEYQKYDISIPVQYINPSDSFETRSHIGLIQIEGLTIPIPAQKKNKDEIDAELDTISVPISQHVYLDKASIVIQPGNVLLLDGESACGKSITLNVFAGLYTGNKCRSMQISFRSNLTVDAEFNEILGSRCYISQMLSDEYKHRGKIAFPIFKMFPGAETIEEVSDFLINVFSMKPTSIPESLTELPHSKLSGGEIQRYAVASQVWQAMKVRPDILILDEADKALDKKTGMKMMDWIVTNLGCFCIIISHLTEVKDMFLQKGIVSQIWTYSEDPYDNQRVIIVPLHIS